MSAVLMTHDLVALFPRKEKWDNKENQIDYVVVVLRGRVVR
jgi:hypothetical protein